MSSPHLQIPLSLNMSFGSNTKRNSPFLSTFLNNLNYSSIPRFHLAGKPKYRISASNSDKNKTDTPESQPEPEQERIPKHVAMIMDGNRRWAKSKGLPPLDGYRAGGGGKAFEQLMLNCLKSGVKVLTVYALSTDNWRHRPKEEVNSLPDLFTECMACLIETFVQNKVRLSFIGRRENLPEPMQELMCVVEQATNDYKRMHVLICYDYSGQYDMTEATKKIAEKVKCGALQVEDIDAAVFEQHLSTNVIDEFPNPDLVIRSSGELRLSNVMLWQLAYTEMFFTKKHFPEFDETDFMEAITAFQQRRRRFGGEAT